MAMQLVMENKLPITTVVMHFFHCCVLSRVRFGLFHVQSRWQLSEIRLHRLMPDEHFEWTRPLARLCALYWVELCQSKTTIHMSSFPPGVALLYPLGARVG
eukprot:5593999-Amphidinium_carterae.1